MSKNSSSSGLCLGDLFSVLFVGLKLSNIIDWNWWFVLSPLLAGFIFGLLLTFIQKQNSEAL